MAEVERIILGVRAGKPLYLEKHGTGIELFNCALNTTGRPHDVIDLNAIEDISPESVFPMPGEEYSIFAGLNQKQQLDLAGTLYGGTVRIDDLQDVCAHYGSYGITNEDCQMLRKLARKIADTVWAQAKKICDGTNKKAAERVAKRQKADLIRYEQENIDELTAQLNAAIQRKKQLEGN